MSAFDDLRRRGGSLLLIPIKIAGAKAKWN
jgi:hypothetical protein